MSGLHSAEIRAWDRIERLAMLLGANGQTYSANPSLAMILPMVPLLTEHPAAALAQAAIAQTGRDAVLKHLINASHDPGLAADPLVAAIDDLAVGWEQAMGAFAAPLAAARSQALDHVSALAADLTPAADLARLTGETDRLRIALLPSLFLPPPQTGRHSALVAHADGSATAHLAFGYPLTEDPARYGITRPWLIGGGWHYGVNRFIHRHWPTLAPAFQQQPDLAATLTAALVPHRPQVTWPLVIAEHLSIALKCQLSRMTGTPDKVHRGFAKVRGLAFFDWFDDWIMAAAQTPADFVTRLHALPAAMAADRQALIDLAARTISGPPTINLALSQGQDRARLVVPDAWPDALLDQMRDRWALISSHWQRAGEQALDPTQPALLFGIVGSGDAADQLARIRGLPPVPSGDVMVALVPAERPGLAWRILLLAETVEQMTALAAEQTLDLFHAIAWLRAGRFVRGTGPGGF